MILGGKLPGKVGRRSFFLKWPHGQEVKTSPFHGGNPGSIPGGVTIKGPAHQCGPFPLAAVAELADAQDLGSCGNTVQVQVLSAAPLKRRVGPSFFSGMEREGLEP